MLVLSRLTCPVILEPGASRSRALRPRFEPLRTHPLLLRKFRLAVDGTCRAALTAKSLGNCDPAEIRRLRTTPEIAGFEYENGRGPGI